MPWKEKTVKESRVEFVKRVLAREKNKSALCREYGISRVTGDKWIKRYLNGECMDNQSTRPFHSPNRISPEMEALIVQARLKEPAIGAVKTRRMLINAGLQQPPAASTINEVFRRNGLITKAASEAARPIVRFAKDEPNDMWQADFKGKFLMQNRKHCHPLAIIDDCSRACLCADAKENEQLIGTMESFLRTFRQYGLPKVLLCDNGTPWGSSQSTSITRFEVWLMELGVLCMHIRPSHPQTQGKIERFNGSYKRERLAFYTPEDIQDAQRSRLEYMNFYNFDRPHCALDLDVPMKHYTPSSRKYPEIILPWEYEAGGELRKIKDSGYLTYNGHGYYLSEGLAGKEIMIYPSESRDGIFNIVFRQFQVAKLDLNANTIISRRVYLLHDDPRSKL